MKMIRIEELSSEFFNRSEDNDIPQVQHIIDEIRKSGDKAVREFSLQFDHVKIKQFAVGQTEIKRAYSSVTKRLLSNIKKASDHLRAFSEKQIEAYKDFEFEMKPGVFVGQRIIPIERVGVYVPGGRYPLISSLLMGVIPAKVAGVDEIVVCSPPLDRGAIQPAVLVAADISGVDEIYKIGGAQAVAAMAYGTQSIKRVNKVVGPGNKFVNAAKKAVYGKVGIDFIAGPTEILIIADKEANASFIAADLIAQAEHDVHAKALLLTDSGELIEDVRRDIGNQLITLKTSCVAKQSLEENGLLLKVNSLEEAVEFANRKAPEHLEIHMKNPERYLSRLKNYGSLFIGQYSSEVLGDYSSGLNHILPTSYASKYTGGLGVKDFIKIQTQLRVTKEGFLQIGPIARNIAEAEGLEGHARSVSIRMKRI